MNLIASLRQRLRTPQLTWLALWLIVLGSVFLIQPPVVQGQESGDTVPDNMTSLVKMPEYMTGTVTKILEEKRVPSNGQEFYVQNLEVQVHNRNESIEISAGSDFQPLTESQRLKVGTQVVLAHQEVAPDQYEYVLADIYRVPTLMWLVFGFFALVLFIARRQGFFSILGMVLSLFILTYQIVPQILAGQNPIVVSLLGCLMVATLTVYLSHGVTRESHIALASMFMTLFSVTILSYITVQMAHLVGLGSEEAYYLQFNSTTQLNLQGLLLAGIMLGTLGVLDDITIAQVSIVTQLKEAKPDIDFIELYSRGLSVGKDHVASLVNTLILAYAGSSLPLFLLFTMNKTQPAWVAINSQMVAEEVVRTLTGSIGLVLAVPLATLAACYFAIYRPQPKGTSTRSLHHHSHGHSH